MFLLVSCSFSASMCERFGAVHPRRLVIFLSGLLSKEAAELVDDRPCILHLWCGTGQHCGRAARTARADVPMKPMLDTLAVKSNIPNL